MLNTILKYVPASWLILALSSGPAYAASAADTIKGGLNTTNQTADYAEIPLPVLIGNIIQALLGIVGVIFLVLTIYGGIMYMTAGGDPGKVEKAKKIIINSVIGLVLIIGAYAFAKFVVTTLADASNFTQSSTPPAQGG